MSWCLSGADRLEIVALARAGCSDSEIARATGRDRTTVRNARAQAGVPCNGKRARVNADEARRLIAKTEAKRAYWLGSPSSRPRRDAA